MKPQYVCANSFAEGHASVCKGESRWYMIDTTGEVAFGPFGSASDFEDGVVSVWHDNGPALLRKDGTIVQIRDVDWLSNYCSNGRIEFALSDTCGYVDRDGTVVIPASYDQASIFSDGLAAVQLNGRWGYIDTNGAMVIESRFDAASFFKGGLAYVKVRDKSCYIDVRGNVVLETAFKGGFPFSEGLTPVYIEEV
ncbi:MAG: WG repeat-containing protein [Planctomycetes bacterium]|nr:WG repeat-containing protein [Planctomycetota bacterium]